MKGSSIRLLQSKQKTEPDSVINKSIPGGVFTSTGILADCLALDIEHVEATGNTTHGSIVAVKCNDDYTLVGISELTCTDGAWNNDAPSCYKGMD